jgi:hypothetical protein
MPTMQWPWLKDDKKEEDKKVELPKELEDRLKAQEASITTSLTSKLDERLKGLDSLTAFAADYKKEKEEAAEKERLKKTTKTQEQLQAESEDMAAAMLNDPKKVINDEILKSPLAQIAFTTSAENLKRTIFQDDASEYPYYSGDIKKEIDDILSKQNLQFRNDAVAIKNTYHTVIGRHMSEINEGKIKSRFASSSSSLKDKGTGGTQDEKVKIEMSEDIKKMARLTGMTEADALALTQKHVDAGDLEYV